MKMEWETPELVEFNRTARGQETCLIGSGNTCSVGGVASMDCADGTVAGGPFDPTCHEGGTPTPGGF